jgi:hypothetical protein
MFSFLGRVLRARVERRAEVADLVRSRAVSKVAFNGVLGVDGCCRGSCGDMGDCCSMSVVYHYDSDTVTSSMRTKFDVT